MDKKTGSLTDTELSLFFDLDKYKSAVDYASGSDRSVFVFFEECKPFKEMDYVYIVDLLREKGKMPYTSDELDNIFTYYAPTANQPERYEEIRSAARVFAKTIVANTSPSPEQTLAIRKLEEVVMRANQCIALRG